MAPSGWCKVNGEGRKGQGVKWIKEGREMADDVGKCFPFYTKTPFTS
jgi:hypothetical protein